jgi:uncharacterized OsmC-like protein
MSCRAQHASHHRFLTNIEAGKRRFGAFNGSSGVALFSPINQPADIAPLSQSDVAGTLSAKLQNVLYLSISKGENQMTAVAAKTALTGCLAPIDKGGLEQLIANGKANPNVIKTLKCKTVAEGKFRHANYIRNLPPYIVDEPPALLGDDTAPNPSEASLAALGSCIAVGLHANAVHRGWTVNKLELQLEGDLNITAVWGTGDISEKPVGFTDVRIKVDMECEGVPQAEIDALIDHVKKWSPVANTFTRPVNLEVSA